MKWLDWFFPKELKLEIELVPASMHGANVRSRLEPHVWKLVCKQVHKSHHRCEVCNQSGLEQGFTHPVECHEVWRYTAGVQKLQGLQSLCPLCHKCKHMGLAGRQGYQAQALGHFQAVNLLSRNQALQLLKEAEQTAYERSNIHWRLDLTYLNRYPFINDSMTSDELKNCKKLEF